MTVPDEPETKQIKPSPDKTGARPSAPTGRNADRHLLEQLVCPITRGALRYDSKSQELISERASLAYPIRHGVPLMTETAARPLTEAELAAFKAARPPKP